jgi:hypothetical protein
MAETRAVMLGVATFVVTLALCAALFLALDISAIYLLGAAIAVAAGAFGVYYAARRDVHSRKRA